MALLMALQTAATAGEAPVPRRGVEWGQLPLARPGLIAGESVGCKDRKWALTERWRSRATPSCNAGHWAESHDKTTGGGGASAGAGCPSPLCAPGTSEPSPSHSEGWSPCAARPEAEQQPVAARPTPVKHRPAPARAQWHGSKPSVRFKIF